MTNAFPPLDQLHVGFVGLGYVGLPLALAFSRHFKVTGFDIDPLRIAELDGGVDRTGEASGEDLAGSGIRFSGEASSLRDCAMIIVTVPTPVDEAKQPDLRPLFLACDTIGANLAPGATVVFESTVYPGATEEDCVPRIEARSAMRLDRDFYVGYSPERVNPGDPVHRIETVVKVIAGSTPEATDFIDRVYGKVVTAGTYRASSIKVAEAAKILENTQRDVNIALINEFAILMNRMGVETLDVLETAGTKWNFLPFRPGLVGGHCISVDPYYLAHKAKTLGLHPEMIQAGRRINDAMGEYVAVETVRLLMAKGRSAPLRVLILGFTFKENCRDSRNTRVIEIHAKLRSFGIAVDIHDPEADGEEIQATYGISLTSDIADASYDAAVVAVGHQRIRDMGVERIRGFLKPGGVLYDLKGVFPKHLVDARL